MTLQKLVKAVLLKHGLCNNPTPLICCFIEREHAKQTLNECLQSTPCTCAKNLKKINTVILTLWFPKISQVEMQYTV